MTNASISSPATAPAEGQTSNFKRQTPNFKRRKARGANRLAFGVWRLAFGVKHRAAAQPLRSASSFPKRRAFTLVEMLLVLVILAVLAAIVIPKFAGRSQQARESAAKTDISNLEVALDSFEIDTGFYPQGGTGLSALIEQPNNAQNWKGPYLKKSVPVDPWGNPYVYSYPGKNNAKSYDLMSGGPDGRTGTDDDVTNWDKKK